MLDVSTNAATIAVNYDQAPRLVSTTIVKVFRKIGSHLQRTVQREKLQGQVLTRRTGTLSRAIFYKIVLAAQDVILILGADIKKAAHARIHELGGDVVPKTADHLTIPLDAARTAKGVARLSAREFIANPQALGFDHAFVNPAKTAIMGSVDVGGDEEDVAVVPVFALKKKITLPARPYLRSTVQDKREYILTELGLGTAQAVQDASTGRTTIAAPARGLVT